MSGFLSKRTEINRKRILDGTVEVYKKKGSGFTMNDISEELHMSKKTIYTIFRDKESLLYTMVDYFFDNVKRGEQEVWESKDLSEDDKLIRLLATLPETSRDIDFTSLYEIKNKYPRVEKRIQERLESDWERTLELIQEGIKNGTFRECNLTVFQLTFEAAIERFIRGDELRESKVKYADALTELATVMVRGIMK
jgi:AcrR family transcriptional regulator